MPPVRLNLLDAVWSSVEDLGPLLDQRRIAIMIDIPQKLAIKTDARRFSRVLRDELAGAVRRSQAGRSVAISARRKAHGRMVLTIGRHSRPLSLAAERP